MLAFGCWFVASAGVSRSLDADLDGSFRSGVKYAKAGVGDSLDVLLDPDCEIADPGALLEVLCELAPTTFCDDD